MAPVVILLQHLHSKLFKGSDIFSSQIQQRDRGAATLCFVTLHQPQTTQKCILLFSLLFYGDIMQSLFLVTVIPLYLGEVGQVQDKLLGSKIYSSKWSVCLYCEGCLQNGFTPDE